MNCELLDLKCIQLYYELQRALEEQLKHRSGENGLMVWFGVNVTFSGQITNLNCLTSYLFVYR